jgi:hypothetical protein
MACSTPQFIHQEETYKLVTCTSQEKHPTTQARMLRVLYSLVHVPYTKYKNSIVLNFLKHGLGGIIYNILLGSEALDTLVRHVYSPEEKEEMSKKIDSFIPFFPWHFAKEELHVFGSIDYYCGSYLSLPEAT